MTSIFRILFLIFLIINCLKGIAQKPIVDSIITAKKLQAFVSEIAHDSLQGRKWNAEGGKIAADIIAHKMAAIGLKRIKGINGYFDDLETIGRSGQMMAIRNVVGIWPGTTKANEIVVFSAHYDHLGTLYQNSKNAVISDTDYLIQKDSIYNGANDDASGVAAMLALAEYFVALGNQKRTIIFAAFSAEEMGLFGSKAMVENLGNKNIITNINLEMLGRPNAHGCQPFITGDVRSDFIDTLNSELKKATKIEKYFLSDLGIVENLFIRSDNYYFYKKRIVAHTIMLTTTKDKYYHTLQDESNTLDYENMSEIVRNIAIASKCFVNGKKTPQLINHIWDMYNPK